MKYPMTDPIQSETIKEPKRLKIYKKKYGISVYISNGLWIAVLLTIVTIFILKYYRNPDQGDLGIMVAGLLIVFKQINSCINEIYLQYQTNTGHQRINQMKEDKKFEDQFKKNEQNMNSKFMDVRTVP